MHIANMTESTKMSDYSKDECGSVVVVRIQKEGGVEPPYTMCWSFSVRLDRAEHCEPYHHICILYSELVERCCSEM